MSTLYPSTTTGVRAADDHHRHGPTDGTGRWSGGRVLVLNATFEPINVCTVRRATVLLLKEKAEVIELGDKDLHWATGSSPAGGHPARHLRPRAARPPPAQDHPPCRVRARRLAVPVLRRPHER